MLHFFLIFSIILLSFRELLRSFIGQNKVFSFHINMNRSETIKYRRVMKSQFYKNMSKTLKTTFYHFQLKSGLDAWFKM